MISTAINTAHAKIQKALLGRLFQVTLVSQITLILLFAISIPQNNPVMPAILGTANILLFFVYVPLRKGNINVASEILIAVMVCCISAIMWAGEGLRSAATLAYPGVLIFCVMIGNRRMFICAYLAMMIFMVILVRATLTGWREVSATPSLSWYVLMEYVVVVSSVTYVIRVLAGDLFNLISQMDGEVQRINESKTRIQHMAQHDTLTGLPTRNVAEQRFQEALSDSTANGKNVAIMFIDLDNFKVINDTWGHLVGDDVLQTLSRTLSLILRKSDTLIRLGGDEFLLIMPHVDGHSEVIPVLEKIVRTVNEPIPTGNTLCQASCSVGVVFSPEQGTEFGTLLHKADEAMYQSKAAGRNRFRFFSSESNDKVLQ